MQTTLELLKAVRIIFGYSQKDMAARAGVSPRSIARLEAGGEYSLKTFVAVQRALEKQGVSFLPKDDGTGYGIRMPAGWESNSVEQGRQQD